MHMKKVALLYDFDKTLCGKDMQEYSLIPSLGYQNPGEFWKEVTEITKQNHMDAISAYLYVLQMKYRESGRPLKQSDFTGLGEKIELFPGVDTWFDRINAYGKELGLEVEHYIISSGMSEIIEGTTIHQFFKKVYACKYYYDENGYAIWPAQIVNYTVKTQYIFRINKQVLDVNEDEALNEYIDMNQRPIPFTRMIYIADGITDVPCMRLVKEYGGKSIAVYQEGKDTTARQLIDQGRVNYMALADYREGQEMEKTVQKILNHIKADSELADIEGIYR